MKDSPFSPDFCLNKVERHSNHKITEQWSKNLFNDNSQSKRSHYSAFRLYASISHGPRKN